MRKRGPRSALKTWSKRAATRMESLVWEEKLDRIKAYFQSELTDTNNQGEPLGSSSFILNRQEQGCKGSRVCFNTHIELIGAEMPQTVCLIIWSRRLRGRAPGCNPEDSTAV